LQLSNSRDPHLGDVRHDGCPSRRGLWGCHRRHRAHPPQSLTALRPLGGGHPCGWHRDGDQALEESAIRADELAAAGGDNGAAIWRRITDAVERLANKVPPGSLH
jgi:hypothetical protein